MLVMLTDMTGAREEWNKQHQQQQQEEKKEAYVLPDELAVGAERRNNSLQQLGQVGPSLSIGAPAVHSINLTTGRRRKINAEGVDAGLQSLDGRVGNC